jgi:hypothetical protein
MMIFAVEIKYPIDVPVQGFQDTDARHHCRVVVFDDFDQRYMRSYLSEKGRVLVRTIVAAMDRRPVKEAK